MMNEAIGNEINYTSHPIVHVKSREITCQLILQCDILMERDVHFSVKNILQKRHEIIRHVLYSNIGYVIILHPIILQ